MTLIILCRTISGPGAVHPGYVIFSSLDNVYIKVIILISIYIIILCFKQ